MTGTTDRWIRRSVSRVCQKTNGHDTPLVCRRVSNAYTLLTIKTLSTTRIGAWGTTETQQERPSSFDSVDSGAGVLAKDESQTAADQKNAEARLSPRRTGRKEHLFTSCRVLTVRAGGKHG